MASAVAPFRKEASSAAALGYALMERSGVPVGKETDTGAKRRATGLGECHRSVQRPLGRGVGELGDGRHYPPPRRRPIIIAGESELISPGGAFLQCLLAVALEHQLRRTPNIDLGYHTGKRARLASTKA